MNVGLFYLRQLFFAKFDLHVHTDQGIYVPRNGTPPFCADWLVSDDTNYTKLWNIMKEEISLIKPGKMCPGQGERSFSSPWIILTFTP